MILCIGAFPGHTRLGRNEKMLFIITSYCILQSDLEDFVFKLYDINEDGKIGFLEFMMMMTIVNEGTIEQKVTQLFR